MDFLHQGNDRIELFVRVADPVLELIVIGYQLLHTKSLCSYQLFTQHIQCLTAAAAITTYFSFYLNGVHTVHLDQAWFIAWNSPPLWAAHG